MREQVNSRLYVETLRIEGSPNLSVSRNSFPETHRIWLRDIKEAELRKNGLKLHPNLNQLDGLIYGYSERKFGNMSFVYGPQNNVLGNRTRFLSQIGIDLNNLVVMRPVHDNHVEVVGGRDRGRGARELDTGIVGTDALVTTETNVAVVLLPADCLAISMVKEGEIASMVHAGREGTEKEIVAEALTKFKELGFNDFGNLQVGIGPAIRCYELPYLLTTNPERWLNYVSALAKSEDDDVSVVLEQLAKDKFKFTSSRTGALLHVDIIGANMAQLERMGVPRQNIDVMPYCTRCMATHGHIFSYDMSTKFSNSPDYPEGRFMAVVQLI